MLSDECYPALHHSELESVIAFVVETQSEERSCSIVVTEGSSNSPAVKCKPEKPQYVIEMWVTNSLHRVQILIPTDQHH
jgi:hypothetical protein